MFSFGLPRKNDPGRGDGEGFDGRDCGCTEHDPKARPITKIDDFAYVKESVLLLAASDLGLLDKNEKDTLTKALNLRN